LSSLKFHGLKQPIHQWSSIVNSSTRLDKRSFSESEGQGWCADENKLDDPRPLEPKMQIVSSERAWGFHRRAELLNGRMAMLGFAIGVVMELITGQGILHQIGLQALLQHH
jgi:hypothetical protein